MPKLKRTLKERRFINAYIANNGNAAKTYRVLHPTYTGENAKVLGCQALTKLNLTTTELLDEMGMTDEALAEVLKAGLEATKTVGLVAKEVDDYPTIHKYLDTAFKLKGTYPAEKHQNLVDVEGELKFYNAKQKLIDKISRVASRGGEGKDPK